MTVTTRQWAAAAVDHGLTVADLHAKIHEIDDSGTSDRRDLPPLHYDRDGDPITLGQLAMLFEARSYRFIAETILPNRYWIATIWSGIDEDLDDPPVVLESSVFRLEADRDRLPPSSYRTRHANLADALDAHTQLVATWIKAHL